MFNHTTRRPGGVIILTDAGGNVVEHDTVQCCHCGNHWVVKPGSGAVRGWCVKCQARHCGSQGCMECLTFEKRLDLFEKGLVTSL